MAWLRFKLTIFTYYPGVLLTNQQDLSLILAYLLLADLSMAYLQVACQTQFQIHLHSARTHYLPACYYHHPLTSSCSLETQTYLHC